MTSTAVSDAAGFLNVSNALPPRNNVQNAATSQDSDFSKIMNSMHGKKDFANKNADAPAGRTAGGKEQGTSANDTKKSQDDKGIAADKSSETKNAEKKSADKASGAEKDGKEKQLSAKDAGENEETVTDISEDDAVTIERESYAALLQALQEFGISADEVNASMEKLGLTEGDLLSADRLTALLSDLNGKNAAFFVEGETPETYADALLSGLALPEDAAAAETAGRFTLSPADSGVTEELLNQLSQEIPELPEEGNLHLREADHAAEETGFSAGEETTVFTEEEAAVSAPSQETSGDAAQTGAGELAAGTKETVSEAPQAKAEKELPREEFAPGLAQPQENTQAQATPEAAEALPLPEGTSTEDIMEQITEYIRVQTRPEATELEMQLHPASLGTINVQIAARENGMTAQFTAQNDSVRAIIEAQLVQLKEQFEQAGLKVEAVEVTVASHEFEQNLDQNNNANQDAGGEPQKRRGIRRLSLEEVDSLFADEELADEDRIAAEMLRANGNTLDYQA